MIASWDFLQDFQKRSVEAEQELLQRTKDHPLGGLRFFDLVGFPEVREWEEKYLPQGATEQVRAIPGPVRPDRQGQPGALSRMFPNLPA